MGHRTVRAFWESESSGFIAAKIMHENVLRRMVNFEQMALNTLSGIDSGHAQGSRRRSQRRQKLRTLKPDSRVQRGVWCWR